ncbi:MAG TPA: cupredoxin domain-containing protein [Nitrososphaeraceae archaeon]
MGHAMYEWIYVGTVVALLVWVGADAWNIEHKLEAVPPQAQTIKAIGQQWFWTFEHANGTQEIGQLHVKAGVPYRFETVSKDVIHSFNIPDFTILMDAVPGRVNTVWNMFDKPGEYLIQCREYCGLLHYSMRANLFVEPATATGYDYKPTNQTTVSTAGGAGGASSTTTTAATTTAASGPTLSIPVGASTQGNPAYDPNPMTVKKGDTIQVQNKDQTPHTVTSGKGLDDPAKGKLFDTSIIAPGASGKVTTASLKSGEYPFHCEVHPYMTGTLKVQ